MPSTVSLPVPDGLAARLDAQSAASGVSVPDLAASLLDEGLKTRQFPGIVYRGGTAGRRASLVGGPDVWQVVRALNEVPVDGFDPEATVSVEANLHPRQISLAVRFYEAYPEEIEAMLAANGRAVELADEMIAERERTIEEQQLGLDHNTPEHRNSPDLSF